MTFIKESELDLAGWLSIANAVLAVPSVAMSMFLEAMEGLGVKIVHGMLILVTLGLFLYVIASLRRLLNSRFQFHDVDVYVSLLIWGNVILGILDILTLWSSKLEFLVSILSIFAFIPFGILAIMFATRLLRLHSSLYGLLKPFSYLTIIGGACYITVLLAPLGIIAGAIADVILGIIFFRAADEPLPPGQIFSAPIE